VREEFYRNDKLLELTDSLGAFRNKLKEFICRYNNYRLHRELDQLTPMEYYVEHVIRVG
jgi:transposase InsO family protein